MIKRGKSEVLAEVEREREAARRAPEVLRRRLEGVEVSKNVRRGVTRTVADEQEYEAIGPGGKAVLSELAALRLEVRALRDALEQLHPGINKA